MGDYKMTLSYFDGNNDETWEDTFENVSVTNLKGKKISLIVPGKHKTLEYWIESYEENGGKYPAKIMIDDISHQGIYPFCRLSDYNITDNYVSIVVNYGTTS